MPELGSGTLTGRPSTTTPGAAGCCVSSAGRSSTSGGATCTTPSGSSPRSPTYQPRNADTAAATGVSRSAESSAPARAPRQAAQGGPVIVPNDLAPWLTRPPTACSRRSPLRAGGGASRRRWRCTPRQSLDGAAHHRRGPVTAERTAGGCREAPGEPLRPFGRMWRRRECLAAELAYMSLLAVVEHPIGDEHADGEDAGRPPAQGQSGGCGSAHAYVELGHRRSGRSRWGSAASRGRASSVVWSLTRRASELESGCRTDGHSTAPRRRRTPAP